MAHKRTDTHWHLSLDDIVAVVNAGGYGASLYKAIRDYNLARKANRATESALMLSLLCGGCSASFYFAIDKLYHDHFERRTDGSDIACPHCGHDRHHYHDNLVYG
ncbi:MAG: hypothetical protein FJZ47_05675 [Candidatus Tectomicrobia bacterium]|uniref:Uncharacterized protein n=1 Tax=Tectimicrobiota bacterium TaxID=2528274 RepID=A0A937VYH1_UNCTE|nr:hypothetical protein [Candidatus Tectomicrobia bacterium]